MVLRCIDRGMAQSIPQLLYGHFIIIYYLKLCTYILYILRICVNKITSYLKKNYQDVIL